MAVIVRRFLVAALVVVLGAGGALVPVSVTSAEPVATVVCQFSDRRFTEISGMTMSQAHPGVLWLHNDSGDGPYIYAVDSSTCKTLATVTLAGIQPRDIEAIASGRDGKGRPILWIGDIGDNNDSWPDVRLYRIREPAKVVTQTVTPTTFRFTYSDRPHNAEALIANPTSQQLWVVTKQMAHGRIYRLPRQLSTTAVNVARPVGTVGGLVTDAAMRPDGSGFVLRNYVDGELFSGRPPGKSAGRIELPFQLQGEAVTWTPDGSALLLASERENRLLRLPVR